MQDLIRSRRFLSAQERIDHRHPEIHHLRKRCQRLADFFRADDDELRPIRNLASRKIGGLDRPDGSIAQFLQILRGVYIKQYAAILYRHLKNTFAVSTEDRAASDIPREVLNLREHAAVEQHGITAKSAIYRNRDLRSFFPVL